MRVTVNVLPAEAVWAGEELREAVVEELAAVITARVRWDEAAGLQPAWERAEGGSAGFREAGEHLVRPEAAVFGNPLRRELQSTVVWNDGPTITVAHLGG